MGQVQHYFRSKDEMLIFACRSMVERTNRRIQEQVASLPQPPSPRDILRTVMTELQPLDEERRAGTRIWIGFLARAVVEPALAAFMRETWINSHTTFAGLIRDAQESGEFAADLDPDRVAAVALGFADGLVSHVLIGHYSGEAALAAVDDFLDRWFSATPAG
jgi:AcrR family transcriptional regulator